MTSLNARDVYFGTYLKFFTDGKKYGAALSGPDNAIGDIGTIEWDQDANGRQQAWLVNPYSIRVGHFSPADSYNLAVYQAKGWTMRYVLSFVALTVGKSKNDYWGEIALIAYNPRYEDEIGAFLKTFSKRMGEGFRPNPDLDSDSLERAIADPTSWTTTQKIALPKFDSDTMMVKDHRTLHDKLLDKARSRNLGCYIISWAFIALLVLAAIYGLHLLGLF
ncbi:hypothetical protein [Slackia heliotrinireducens]|uniref:hypothetical protein n=1 Tax=Slackia heliotrinireducens TaxID=84110 RepID=UPI0033147E4F